jgi:predicted transcriptional regulator
MAPVEPSPCERIVLRALWKLRSATVRDVWTELFPAGQRSFNTVQTQLRILERKGLAAHRVEGTSFVYQARYTPADAARCYLETACGGDLEEAVRSLVGAAGLDAEGLRGLERLVARLRREHEAATERPSTAGEAPPGSG